MVFADVVSLGTQKVELPGMKGDDGDSGFERPNPE
jgi:hypothetical protein